MSNGMFTYAVLRLRTECTVQNTDPRWYVRRANVCPHSTRATVPFRRQQRGTSREIKHFCWCTTQVLDTFSGFYSAEIGPNDADDGIPPSDECCCALRTLESCLIIRSRFGTTVVEIIPFIARNHGKEWADFKAGRSCASSEQGRSVQTCVGPRDAEKWKESC
jgi:hypothetical protein